MKEVDIKATRMLLILGSTSSSGKDRTGTNQPACASTIARTNAL